MPLRLGSCAVRKRLRKRQQVLVLTGLTQKTNTSVLFLTLAEGRGAQSLHCCAQLGSLHCCAQRGSLHCCAQRGIRHCTTNNAHATRTMRMPQEQCTTNNAHATRYTAAATLSTRTMRMCTASSTLLSAFWQSTKYDIPPSCHVRVIYRFCSTQ